MIFFSFFTLNRLLLAELLTYFYWYCGYCSIVAYSELTYYPVVGTELPGFGILFSFSGIHAC